MMQMRTHTCGELRLTDAGKHVKIVGWMENVRVVGQNFAFVVLRDFYGTTQVVVESQEMMDVINGLNKESTISVEGTVRERASKNPKQATGDVEVLPEKIEVLGRCRYNSLPFEINRSREADETQRLIMFRCRVKCLMYSGLSQAEAEKVIASTPLKLELFYDVGRGSFAIDAEAVGNTPLYNPYTGKEIPDET